MSPAVAISENVAQSDTWLSRWLTALGRANTDHIYRALKSRHCAACHRPVLAGLDSDVAALPVLTDPAPITTRAELAALALGLDTYALRRHPAGWVIDRREPRYIQRQPADSVSYRVLAAHDCRIFWPANLRAPEPPIPAALGDDPPF